MKTLLATLLILMVAAPAMAADVVIWKLVPDRPDLSEEEYNAGILHKGEIFGCEETGAIPIPWTTSENRTVVRVPGLSVVECEGYMEEWVRNIDYAIVDHKERPNDRYDVDVFALVPGVSQYGGITRNQVEAYLNRWNATVTGVSTNNVTFRFFVAQLASSEAFFGGHNVNAVVFNELDYNVGTGVHQIEADYSGAPYVGQISGVNAAIEDSGGIVISNDGNVVVYEIDRNTALLSLRDDIKYRLDDILWSRRYYVNSADVDTVVAAGGMEITRTQWDNNLKDTTLDP